MKLTFIVLCVILSFTKIKSQVSIINTITQNAICYGTCDGEITFTVTNAVPPYTVITANSSNCSNPLPYTANSNTFTIGNMCPCSGLYTFQFFDVTNNLIGTSYNYFQTTATNTLNVSVSNIVATSCPTCCTGTANMLATGGSTQNGPVIFWLDGVYLAFNFFPAYNICAGTHTVCGKDNYGCERCTTFTMPISNNVGIEDLQDFSKMKIYPNPAQNEFYIFNEQNVYEKSILTITSLFGEKVKEMTINDSNLSTIKVSTDGLAKGHYLISQKYVNSNNIGRASLLIN